MKFDFIAFTIPFFLSFMLLENSLEVHLVSESFFSPKGQLKGLENDFRNFTQS